MADGGTIRSSPNPPCETRDASQEVVLHSLSFLLVAALSLAPAMLPPASQHGIDQAALQDPSRPDTDRAQDADRKALQVYEFIGIQPGWHVADVYAGGGYNTHLLSNVVGESGHVHSVIGFFAPVIKERFGNDIETAIRERVASLDRDNISLHPNLEDVPDEMLNAVVSVRNIHDIAFFGADEQAKLMEMKRAMKPGGIVGVVEVATPHEGWHEATHRRNAESIKQAFLDAGFEYVDSSDILANPDDDHSEPGFPNRHKADRYLLKFRKPS